MKMYHRSLTGTAGKETHCDETAKRDVALVHTR